MSKQKSFLNGPAIRLAFRTLMFGEEGTAGAVLVEATIIVPMLVVLSIYAMDFGLLFYNKMEVQNAAQAGAQWAMANHTYAPYSATPSGTQRSIQSAVQNATSLTGFTYTPREFCGCSTDSSGNPAVTQLASGACTGTTNVVNSTCPSGHGVVGDYVTVTATYAYTSLVPTRLIANTPIASTYTNSATSTVRTQ
jgi:Flp pilus assembly protein TadG